MAESKDRSDAVQRMEHRAIDPVHEVVPMQRTS